MSLELDLTKDVSENLKMNNVVVGARRKFPRGGANDEVEAAMPAAKTGIIQVMKIAYEKAKLLGSAASQLAVAGLIVGVVDQQFRAGLCDPLAKAAISSLSFIPMASAYVSTCDNAMIAYNTAITSSVLLITPLVISAIKTAGKIVVPEEVVEEVATNLVEAVKDPGQAAAKALSVRAQTTKNNNKKSYGGRRRKTLNRKTRSRKTRRRLH